MSKLFAGMEQLFNQQAAMNNMIALQQQQYQQFQAQILAQQPVENRNDAQPIAEPEEHQRNQTCPIIKKELTVKTANKEFCVAELLVSYKYDFLLFSLLFLI